MSEEAPDSPGLAADRGARATPDPRPSGPSRSLPQSEPRSSPSGPTSGFPRVDKYELLEEIGHGGMATVYRARDPRLGRDVAVKIIHKHLRENPEVGTRFVAEARAAAKLRHPGIVDVFDVSGDDDAERYLVAELIHGATLRKVLQGHRDMPAEVGAAIVLQICAALEHAHGSAIIHRDIKPENVLVELPTDRVAASARERAEAASATPPAAAVDEEREPLPRDLTATPSTTQPSVADVAVPQGGRGHARARMEARVREPPPRPRDDAGVVIKITDFGIAKILDATGVTSTGQVLGSPAHMAPEQIEGGDVDARTDVFALGVLMYECLVGHLPFEGKNPAQVLRRVLDGTYPAADRERPAAGGRWSWIVAKALAREAAERTGSAAELGAAIEAELRALGITDPRAEISAYFADPAGYSEALSARLVPRLVARGEAARRAGDIPGAAADFNRALALHPDDLAILRRIGNLTSSAGRRRLARRVGAIVAGSAVLGLFAFQVARAWKAGAARHDPAPPGSGSAVVTSEMAPVADRTAATAAPPPASGAASAEPAAKRPRVPATPGFTLPPPPPVVRRVRFNINPKGAKLFVDGVSQPSFAELSLAVGAHQVEARPNVERCCKKIAQTVMVEAPPAGQPDSVLAIPLTMELQPAFVTLSGAPPNAQLSCPQLGLTCFAGAQKKVEKLPEPSWSGSCSFTAPDKPPRKGHVTLNAGEVNAIPWPPE